MDGAAERRPRSTSQPPPRTSRSLGSYKFSPNRPIRATPAWVRTDGDRASEDEGSEGRRPSARSNYLPVPLTPTLPPEPVASKQNTARGRKFDHERTREPAMASPLADTASRFRAFIDDSERLNPRPDSQRTLVDEAWIQENMPDLSTPWRGRHSKETADGEQEGGFELLSGVHRHWRKVWWMVMNRAWVPLVLRLIIISFSTVALGLSATILDVGQTSRVCQQRTPSTYMAVVVDTVAIAYSFVISFDEFVSKPIGLRSARAKLRLILLDLLFIVFDSANLSLAFNSLRDPRWVCRESNTGDLSACSVDSTVCGLQQGLTAVLLIALLAWLSTFVISILRLVHVLDPQDLPKRS